MLACFDVHGDHLCYGSCELPAGFRVFFFKGGLMCWTIDIPEGAVQPAAPRHVVALVSRAPEIEPYVVVSSWVLRQRADRQFRRHGRWRATVRCVRSNGCTSTLTPASMWHGWLAATASRSCALRSAHQSSSARAGSGSAEATTTSCSATTTPLTRQPMASGGCRTAATRRRLPSSCTAACGRGHSIACHVSDYAIVIPNSPPIGRRR
ncbi:MAG: hypothetical protein KatS3mg038_3353 [Candidatus Kapaibacterium sp.]|nr:MAG: hypothetical protein KatS3mg038_3353 [Candidatus Kapabacteria bacterium]